MWANLLRNPLRSRVAATFWFRRDRSFDGEWCCQKTWQCPAYDRQIYLFNGSTFMVISYRRKYVYPITNCTSFRLLFWGDGDSGRPLTALFDPEKITGRTWRSAMRQYLVETPIEFSKRIQICRCHKMASNHRKAFTTFDLYNFILPLEIDGTLVPLYSHPFGTRKEGCSCKNEIRLRVSTVHFITFSATTGE